MHIIFKNDNAKHMLCENCRNLLHFYCPFYTPLPLSVVSQNLKFIPQASGTDCLGRLEKTYDGWSITVEKNQNYNREEMYVTSLLVVDRSRREIFFPIFVNLKQRIVDIVSEFNLHTFFVSKYLWSSLITLLLHISLMGVEGVSGVDKNLSSDEKRQARHAVYRGSYKFQMPEYLRPDGYAKTIYSSDRRDSDGSYGYEYQTDNGISVKQDSSGYGANRVVTGHYSYIGADGKKYTVNYIADRFG